MADLAIALVTSSRLPEPDPEMEPLGDAFAAEGATATAVPWDRPADWSAFDAAVIRSTWDYTEHLDDFDAWLGEAAAATTLVNPAELIRWNLHKRYLLDLAERGVPVVPTALLVQDTAPPDDLFPGADEVVVKPAVSINAIGAARGRPGDPQLTDHLHALLRTGDVLVQPFVPSVLDRGETSLLFFGARCSHAIRKVPRPGEYRVQEHHGGTVVAHAPTSAELAVAEAAIAAAPVEPVYARVDVVATDDGPGLMELELIEPTLFVDHSPGAAGRFAAAVCQEARRRPRAI